MLDPVHLLVIGLILVTSGAGIGVLVYLARMLGEARATTHDMGQILERVERTLERVEASAERIAEMTREVLRRTS